MACWKLSFWGKCSVNISACPPVCGSLDGGRQAQDYWSGLPFPPPGDLACPEIKSVSLVVPALAVRFFTIWVPWNFPGKNTWVSCHFLLQGIFLTQGSNPHPLHLPALTDRFFTTSAKLVIASFRGQGWGCSWGGAEGALFCTVCPFGTLLVIKQQFRAQACLGSNPCCATYQLHDLEQVSVLYFKLQDGDMNCIHLTELWCRWDKTCEKCLEQCPAYSKAIQHLQLFSSLFLVLIWLIKKQKLKNFKSFY